LSEIGLFSSPPCPLPGGEILCPKLDFSHHPLVLYQEGRSFVRDRTFLVTPLSSTRRGDPLSKIGFFSSPPGPLPGGEILCPRSDFFSSPPCPLPRGVVHCPRSDFSRHPPVLYQEGRSFVQNWTFLITLRSSTKRGDPLSEIGLFSSPPWSSTRRGGLLSEIGPFSSPPVLYREGRSFVQNWTFLITPRSSTKRGGPLSEIGLFSSPPCPLPGGEILYPKLDFSHHPQVLYQEGRSFVQNWTFLITPWSSTKMGDPFSEIGFFLVTPLSSTKRGGPLSEIGLFSSPPCPLPGGEIFCPKLDFSHHPQVLYREG
jgi:hypothetical protein